MKKLIILYFVFLLHSNFVYTQGCVIVRNISGLGQYSLTDNTFSTSDWQLNVTSRYFKSFRDFKGTVDQKTPKQNESVNKVFSLDFTISRLLRNGWSLTLSIPYTVNSRTSSLEHGGPNTTRHATHSTGLSDIQFIAYKWLLKPSIKQKGNIQVGLGIKFATGDYKYQDYFYRNDSTKVLSAVNPSIQLGDGGTGIVTELNTFYYINPSKTINIYGNFYYLISPREVSGTQFTAGRAPTALQIQTGVLDLSVPDVYSMRAGANFNVNKWAFSAGLRYEGAPVYDLFGGSSGGRRAGYTLSGEPGILYKLKNATIYLYVPFTAAHKIIQNVPDKIESKIRGVYTVGAGGSGDYQVFLGAQFKL